MKLSENTVNILKNYASINPSILVKPGNELQTVAPVSRAIFAKAVVEESFPQQFAIYELSRFLGVLSLFKDPELKFEKNSVVILSGRQRVNYAFADASMVIAPPDKEFKFPAAEIEFNITADELTRVIRAAGVLKLPSIEVWCKGDGIIRISAADHTSISNDTFDIEVGESSHEFSMIFTVDNIVKLLPKDYNVKISSRQMSQFVNHEDQLTYYVANESVSKFKKED